MPELPALPLDGWLPTYQTLHRWAQIVGKVRLALAPRQNHWWHVALYVQPRGLTTLGIPYKDRFFELAFDFVSHDLLIVTSDGAQKRVPLLAKPVAAFYFEVIEALGELNIGVHVSTTPQELTSEAIPFDEDNVHSSYEPEWVGKFHRVLEWADGTMKRFSSGFVGKQSPVQFYWGGFDLAYSRFSGRPAARLDSTDVLTREAYFHEMMTFGFWPGTERLSDAGFFAYARPDPEGIDKLELPKPARYVQPLRFFHLPYEHARTSRDPSGVVLEFFQRFYEEAARLASWDRDALERPSSVSRERQAEPIKAQGRGPAGVPTT